MSDPFKDTRDPLVRSMERAAHTQDVETQKAIVVRMRKLNSQVIAERDALAASVDRLTSDKARLASELADSHLIAREQEDAHVAANMRNTHLQERIDQLEAFLNRCYEGSRAPYAEEMDNEHVPMPSASETGGKLLRRMPGIDDLIESAAVEIKDALSETFAEPGIGPIEPEPQDYKVQCRCGWMGQVSALKSLPEFKMGCPDCSAEFVPLNRMTFPVKTKGEQGG